MAQRKSSSPELIIGWGNGRHKSTVINGQFHSSPVPGATAVAVTHPGNIAAGRCSAGD